MPARVRGTVVAGFTMFIVVAVALPAQGAPHRVPAPASAQKGARVASAHRDRKHRRHKRPRIRFIPVSGYGGAFAFNHPGASVNVRPAGRLNFSRGITLEAWALPSSVRGGEAYVLAKTARHGRSPYGLALSDGVPFAYVLAGQRVITADATRPLAAKSWSYLAASYDGTSLELYVEGVGVATTTISGRIARSGGPLQIGGGATRRQSFVGAIGNVRIFDTARSPAQIAADGVSPTKHGPRGAEGLTVTFGQRPSQPDHASASHVSESSAQLTWGAPRGDARAAGYMLFQDDTFVARTARTRHRFTNLVCDTAYAFSVETVNQSGAMSGPTTVPAKTAACPSHVGNSPSGAQAPPPQPTALAPVDILAPSISGAAVVRTDLKAAPGAWGDSPSAFAYQWQDCNSSGASCRRIPGAKGNSYMLGSKDAGKTVNVVVTASNSAGSAQATSATTPMVTMPVQPPTNTSVPSISGQTVVGDTLSAANGSWSSSPTGFAYKWQDCDSSGANCSSISGATGSSYQLATTDAGSTIEVAVTASNSAGSGQATSAATAVVTVPVQPPVNTSVPSISGQTVVGDTLTAGNGSWSNGPTGYSYQWQDCDSSGANCSSISGATGSSYKLTSGDAGSTIDVVVTASNSAGSGQATSTATPVVTVPVQPPANTSLPTISGQTVVGDTLSAANGSWSNGPTGYSYQWQDCDGSGANCSSISGATGSSYKLASGDAGSTIEVAVTAINSAGTGQATSAATSVVTVPVQPPVNTALPTIAGETVVGDTLTAGNGSWSNSPTAFVYQWQDCNSSGTNCSSISGATGSSYKLAATDAGSTVEVAVTAINSAGTDQATSAATSVVTVPVQPPVNTALPTIAGETVVGDTLTAGNGSWSNSPTAFVYQWQDCNGSGTNCSNISGATGSSYKLTSSDAGDTTDVVVTASNSAGAGQATSAATSVVTVPVQPPVNTALPTIAGQTVVGDTLTATNGSWSNSPTAFVYQWQDCNGSGTNCSSISNATGSSYKLAATDAGSTIEVAVTAINSAGTGQATSAATSVVTTPVQPPVNTSLPSISGQTVVGDTLTATNGSWSNSPTAFVYQWQDCNGSGTNCSNISVATGISYTLTSSDAGDTIDVVVTASNSAGSGQATSTTTAVVTVPVQPPVNTSLPTISGQTVVGDTLSAANGSWSGSPTGFAYKWQDCDSSGANCSNISGATGSSYRLASGDAGSTIEVAVTASNSAGSGQATSAATGVVTVPVQPPVNTSLPSISGQTVVGDTLTAANGSWSNSPTAFVYQWQDCNGSGTNCSSISGATSSSYKLASVDAASTIDVVVTASNSAGSGKASSAATGVVTVPVQPPVNTGLPVVSGAAQQGGTLTTTNGSWSNSPASYSYQWQDCSGSGCSNIAGATSSSYKLVSSDVGDTIDVIVTASNTAGSSSQVSAPTGVVITAGTSYAPTYVQSNATLDSTGSNNIASSSAAFASNVTSGDLIVVALGYRATPTVTVSDSLGTTFHAAGSPVTSTQSNGPYTGAIEWGVAPAGGADTVTANFGTDTGYVEVYVQEYNAANPQLDVTASAAALDSATPITSGTATTNYPNELVFGYAMANNTVSAPGAGLTQRQGVGGDISEDKSVSTTGPYAATATGCCIDAYYSQALMATFYGTGPNMAVPSQVTGVSAAGGALSANVTWTAPSSGGTPSSYIIKPYIGATAQTPTTVSAPATSTTVTGLTAGTAYTFTVTASNAAGNGPASAASNSVTPSSGGVPVNSVGPYFTAPTLSTAVPSSCTNGCAVVGQTLGVGTGTWTNAPTGFTYQWDRCATTSAQPPTTASCASLGSGNGAQTANYTVQAADAGHALVPIVTASNAVGASTPTSAAGTCNTGELVAGRGVGNAPTPTAAIATCSPISAVAATTQAGEHFCTNAVRVRAEVIPSCKRA